LIRSRISSIARRGGRLLGIGLCSRHHNDYATHVPILVGIASAIRIERILEFGSGMYSTLTFLNRQVFPDVSHVDSVESDPEWMSKVSAAAKGDPRLSICLVEEPIERVLREIHLNSYDFILVDSSTAAGRRASLIRELAARQDFSALVAVHDFEIGLYRAAAKGFRHVVQYTAYNPRTGILWQTAPDPGTALKQLSKIISRYSKRLQPDDVQAWAAAFRQRGTSRASVN
jgi:predicted O-methyltransferase YrrM